MMNDVNNNINNNITKPESTNIECNHSNAASDEHPFKLFNTIFVCVTMVAIAFSLTFATYAWFTDNRVTKTNLVSSKSGSEGLDLLLSTSGGDSFNGSTEVTITQVNSTSKLLPVSTVDLSSFLYNNATVEGVASDFQLVEGEERYYHGRIYLCAVADDQPEGTKVALYLDEGSSSGGSLVGSADGDILNAARLGLVISDENSVIFKLSDTSNSSDNQTYNTMINGELLGDNQVLGLDGEAVKAYDDPSVALSSYTIIINDASVTLPDGPLALIDLNTIYTIDIYFYLEGCDPDCSDSISFTGTDLHLAFYGILALQEG